MRQVTLPDLARMDPVVQEQVRQRHASMLETIARPGATSADRAMAYGSVGMVLQAGEYYDAAEPALLNAQDLMPGEPRWPYFLARLHLSEGDIAAAIASFTRVLELRPDDVPALVWLGRMYLDQGLPEKAEPLFGRARMVAPRVPAVLAGLGQAALARRDFARAASILEEALSIDPGAQSIHSPLAMAYRGLGDTARAEAHLKQWKNTGSSCPIRFDRSSIWRCRADCPTSFAGSARSRRATSTPPPASSVRAWRSRRARRPSGARCVTSSRPPRT